MAKLIKGKQIQKQGITINSADGHVVATGNLNMSVFEVLTSAAPTTDSSLTNKAYVDAVAQGVIPHAPVVAVSTANITLSGVQTVDSVLLAIGDRVLVAGQTLPAQNGIYVVSATAWSRALDADGTPSYEVSRGDFVFVEEGTVYANSGWVLGQTDSILDTIVPNTNTQVWFKMAAPGSYTADNEGIVINGNIFSIALEGSTLSKSITGLKVSDSVMTQITNLETIGSSIETRLSLEETALSSEIEARSSVDSSLETLVSTSISTEILDRSAADTSLETSLSTEVSTLVEADTSLENLISTEVSDRSSAISSLEDLMVNADNTSLETRLSLEETARDSVDSSLVSLVSTEVSTLVVADSSLESLISTEVSDRSVAVSSIDVALVAVISVDSSLESLVSTEVSDRSVAVSSLEDLISNLATSDTINQDIVPANNGVTTNVVVTTTAFVFATGTIDIDSVSIHVNGIQYSYGVAQGLNSFYTIGTPVAGSGMTLYFDGVVAGFPIETDDTINLKYTVAL